MMLRVYPGGILNGIDLYPGGILNGMIYIQETKDFYIQEMGYIRALITLLYIREHLMVIRGVFNGITEYPTGVVNSAPVYPGGW